MVRAASAWLAAAAAAAAAPWASADIYMHNPRGSNGRGCRDSNDKARSGNEAQRLFDSQNNDNGGYSCPSAYPFACYKIEDEAERATCTATNTGLTEAEAKAQVRTDGTLKHPDATNTPRMMYYAGSHLPIEWTAQHGAGVNSKVQSEIVIQVACEDESPGVFSFTDDCGTGEKTCWPRDGTPVHNQDNTNTQRIEDAPEDQDDYRYGRHESYRFYQFCKNLERNKNLFTADQNLRGNAATATRQNPNNARNGFECPEESEYYPWWQPSMWIDVAVITSDMNKCEQDVLESQNVADRFYCDCSSCTGSGALPNNKEACEEKDGTWKSFPAWNKRYVGVEAPECVLGAFSRDNHLGNVGTDGQPYAYNWTIPSYLAGKDRCVLRLRYNISSEDYDSVSRFGDASLNGEASPVKDRNNNPEGVYMDLGDLCDGGECKLGLAVNTNQLGRTFQDRSFTFRVAEVPEEYDCANIHNLNVRGKRGNIVQTYPAVEYDFVPNNLVATEDDCIHVQWTGSDYNPHRAPNNGEGGPANPNNIGQTKADRSNLVVMSNQRDNHPVTGEMDMFVGGKEVTRRLAFLDQPVDDTSKCLPYSLLRSLNGNNNDATDRDWRNCMKLSGQETPYFNAGLLHAREGKYVYMSTRNNNFSNRGMKGSLTVGPGTKPLSPLAISVISLAIVGSLAFLAFFVAPKVKKKALGSKTPGIVLGTAKYTSASENEPDSMNPESSVVQAGASFEGSPGQTVVALYDYVAQASNQISFSANDAIRIEKTDATGWWQGSLPDGSIGYFPANYVQPVPTTSVNSE
mmetsp:Transcript_1729/g.2723  ORF Transcript_1729/g.2723 Transcript_1729/m.2723 type:complete len:800 (+) Transcript_1729:140-2539(+)